MSKSISEGSSKSNKHNNNSSCRDLHPSISTSFWDPNRLVGDRRTARSTRILDIEYPREEARREYLEPMISDNRPRCKERARDGGDMDFVKVLFLREA